MLLQLQYARQMEKAGKLKVVSAIACAICMRVAHALANADDLCAAGAGLHAFRARNSQRPRDLAVYGGAAVLQASGTGLGFRGLARCCMQKCALDWFNITVLQFVQQIRCTGDGARATACAAQECRLNIWRRICSGGTM